jgi:hypothetical protein
LAILLGAGCASHHRHSPDPGPSLAEINGIRPPRVVAGPLGVLLTNQQDYSARISVQALEDGTPISPALTGNLFQQEGRLLLIPMTDQPLAPKQKSAPSRFRFLWDVAQNRGWVISEPLRGYAEVDAPVRYFLISGPPTSDFERVDDQLLQREDVTVRAGNSDVRFRVWRALDSSGVPLRVLANSGTNTVALLSDIHVEAQTPELFRVPLEYTRYPKPEAMLREVTRKVHPLPYSHSGPGR